jgi:hypothetical protein
LGEEVYAGMAVIAAIGLVLLAAVSFATRKSGVLAEAH